MKKGFRPELPARVGQDDTREAGWRPMSEAPRVPGGYIIICQPGATDHYMVAEWDDGSEGDEQEGVWAWRDQVCGEIVWTDEDMAKAFSPAMWKPLGAPPPSSNCHRGPTPQWVLEWQAAYRERENSPQLLHQR